MVYKANILSETMPKRGDLIMPFYLMQLIIIK